MSQLIGLAGLSNSGKSTSLKYLDPKSTFIISCTNKQLQIPGFRKKYSKVEIKDNKLLGNKEVLVQDPDGYLLRFSDDLGEKELK